MWKWCSEEACDEEQTTLSCKATPGGGIYKRLEQDKLILTPRKHPEPEWEQHVALLVCTWGWQTSVSDHLASMLTGYLCFVFFFGHTEKNSRKQIFLNKNLPFNFVWNQPELVQMTTKIRLRSHAQFNIRGFVHHTWICCPPRSGEAKSSWLTPEPSGEARMTLLGEPSCLVRITFPPGE